MKLFIDTNVMLDFLATREPFFDSAAKIVSLSDYGKVTIFVSTLSYSTISYLLSKEFTVKTIKQTLKNFSTIAVTSDFNNKILHRGLDSDFTDIEDSFQYYSALQEHCDIIITRNKKDFSKSDIPVMTPDEFLSGL